MVRSLAPRVGMNLPHAALISARLMSGTSSTWQKRRFPATLATRKISKELVQRTRPARTKQRLRKGRLRSRLIGYGMPKGAESAIASASRARAHSFVNEHESPAGNTFLQAFLQRFYSPVSAATSSTGEDQQRQIDRSPCRLLFAASRSEA